MPNPNSTIIDELMAAGRGVPGLIIGSRKAPEYFDFSLRGLAGSFVAFFFVTGLNAVLPVVLGMETLDGSVGRTIVSAILLSGLQLLFTAIVLWQAGRLDRIVSYLVADNWVTFFLSLVIGALASIGIGGTNVLLVFGLLIIVITINIGRVVLKLAPLQIAMLLIAQIIGGWLGLVLLGLIFPSSPEIAAQLAALTQ